MPDALVLGGGVVGLNAARMALGLGARVTVLDKSLARLRQLDDGFGRSSTRYMRRPMPSNIYYRTPMSWLAPY